MLNGLTSVAFRALSAEEILCAASESSLACVELDSGAHLAPEEEERAAALGKKAALLGIKISSYATDFTLGDSDSAVFELYCRVASLLGAACVRIRSDHAPSVKIGAEREAFLVKEAEKALLIAEKYNLVLISKIGQYS